MFKKPFTKPEDLNPSAEPRVPARAVAEAPREPAPAAPRPAQAVVAEDRPAAAAAEQSPQPNRLLVGRDVKLKGAEIADCDTLVVEGRVEATMDSRVIQIAQTGAFSGTVSIDVAEIRGRFDGELTARKQLVIHATGRVSGKIRYGKIVIEEGGQLSGDVKSLSADSAAPASAATPDPIPFAMAGKVAAGGKP